MVMLYWSQFALLYRSGSTKYLDWTCAYTNSRGFGEVVLMFMVYVGNSGSKRAKLPHRLAMV